MSSHLTRASIVAVAALALPLATARAQSVWLPAVQGPSLSIEALKPILTEGNDAWTTTTTAFFLSGRIPVSNGVRLVAELPVTHAGFRRSAFGGSGTATSTVIGNPYLGVELGSGGSGISVDGGVRLPLQKEMGPDDFAAGVGVMADFDRMEAYIQDALAISGHLGVRQVSPTGLFVRARGGPTLWIYTGDESVADDTEMLLDYSAQAGFDTGRFLVMGGLTGRTVLSEDGGSWQDRSFHQLGLSGSVAVGGIRPGIHLRIPVDEELGDELRYVLGLQLTVPLR